MRHQVCFRLFLKAFSLALAVIFFPLRAVQALPSGEEVVAGSVSFDRPDPSTLNISASPDSIIQYESFNIGLNETVNFDLPSIDAFSLNRVIGSGSSEILGKLTANGNIILVNTDGIHFGANAEVNAGGLIASTHEIVNTDFLQGRYLFAGTQDHAPSSILNEGSIRSRENGMAVLVSDAIENRGVVEAPLGTVALAAGKIVAVGVSGDGYVSIGVDEGTARGVLDLDGNPITEQVRNTGTLSAPSGKVLLTARSVGQVFASAINLQGTVKADGAVIGKDGVVEITASGPLQANASVHAQKGRIQISSQESVSIQGRYEAADGTVLVTSAQDIKVVGPVTTRGTTTFSAQNDVQVGSDVTNHDGDLTFHADSNRDGAGAFHQATGTTIRTVGSGDILIHSSGRSELASLDAAGSIRLYSAGAPADYSQQPDSVITSGTSFNILNNVSLFASNTRFNISMDWINQGVFTADNSSVNLIGSLDSNIYGSNTFNNLTVIEAEKDLNFEEGKTQTIVGILTLRGRFGQLLEVNSTTSADAWKISVLGNYEIEYVDLKNSTNVNIHGPPLSPLHSKNSRGNSGWNFSDAGPIWTGGGSSASWSDPFNWDGGFTPGPGDSVRFDDHSPSSVIDSPFTIHDLTLASGFKGSLEVGRSLTVVGNVTLQGGTLIAGSQTITIGGDWRLQATDFQAGTSTVVFNDASQYSTILGFNTFYSLASITPSKRLFFEAGATQTVSGALTLEGAKGQLIELRSTDPGQTQWKLAPIGATSIRFVHLGDAYNLSPTPIKALPSNSFGNNTGWDTDPVWSAGAAGNWSTASNWDTGVVPGPTDTVTFDATSVQNSTVDTNFSGTIATLNVNSGYTGTITLSRSLTVSTSYSQAAGTLDVGTQTFTAGGTFALSGGTFNANAGTVNVAGNFSLSGGTFTQGTSTVALTGAAATIDVVTNQIFNNLTFAPTTAGSVKTVGDNDTLIVTGTLTLTEGSINQFAVPSTGTVAARGSISQDSAFDGGTGTVLIDGTGSQTLTGSATQSTGSLPLININKSAGTLTLAGTIRAGGNWVYTTGTLAAGTSTVVFGDPGASGSIISGSHTLNNVTFDTNNASARTWTIVPETTLTVTGTLTFDNSQTAAINVSLGTIAAQGAVTIADSNNYDGSATLLINGTGAQTFTGSATISTGALPFVNINKPSGTLTLAGTIRTARDWTYTAGTLDPGASTVVFADILSISGSHTLNNVEFNGAGDTYSLPYTTTLTVAGTLTLTDGNIDIGTVAAQGAIAQASTFDGGTGTLLINGTGAQTFTGSATTAAGSLPHLNINKSAGTLTLAGTIRTTNSWTFTLGALDAGTSSVVYAGTLSIGGSHTLNNVEFNGVGLASTLPATTTLTVTGTLTLTDGSINTGTVAAQGAIAQASTFDGGTGTLLINGTGAQTFTGSATTAAGSLPHLNINKSAGTLTLAGTIRTTNDWVYTTGTVDPGTSTVVLAGNMVIAGSPTFNDLTLNAAANHFVIPSGQTVTVTGTLTLTNGNINTGTVAAQGTITQVTTSDSGTGTLLVNGTGSQSFTGSATQTAGLLPSVHINKPSGTLTLSGTIRTNLNWRYTAGTLDAGTSTLVIMPNALNPTVTGSHTLNNLTIDSNNNNNSLPLVVALGTTWTTAGTLTLDNSSTGSIATRGTIAAQGAITVADTVDYGIGEGALLINGSGDQTFTGGATVSTGGLPKIVINKASGTLTLAGTLRLTSRWTYTAGTLDAGTSTVALAGGSTLMGSQTLNLVEIRGASTVVSGTTLTVSNTFTMPTNVAFTVYGTVIAGGDLVLTDGTIDGSGTIQARGTNITQASTFDGGSGFLLINGTGSQTFTGSATQTAGDLPTTVLNKTAGTLTLSGTIRTTDNWIYGAGTLDAGTSTLVFAPQSTTSPGLRIIGSHTLNHVTFDSNAASIRIVTIASSTVLTVTGTLTFDNSSTNGITFNGGTLAAQGPITVGDSLDYSGSTILLVNGTGAQTFTGSATVSSGGIPILNMSKPSGTLTLAGTIRTSRDWIYTRGTLDAGTSTVSFAGGTIMGSHTLNLVEIRAATTVATGTILTVGNTLTFPSAVALTVNGAVIANGTLALTDGSIAGTGNVQATADITQASTYDGGAGYLLISGTGSQAFTGSTTQTAGTLPDIRINKTSGTLTLSGTIRTNNDWTYTAGTLDPGTSTIVFVPNTNTVTGSHTLNNVTFDSNASGSTTLTLASGTTLTIVGTLTFDNSSTGAINITGGATVTAIYAQGNIVIADTVNYDGNTTIHINGTGGQSLTGSATAATGGFTNLNIDKPSGTLTIIGTIRMSDSWTYTQGTVDATTNNSLIAFASTITVDGQGTSTTMVFDNVEIASGTITLGGNLDIDGNLTISGTAGLNTSASNYAVNIAGDWTITSSSATAFVSNSSVVTLDGSTSATMNTGGTGTGYDFQDLLINKSGGASVTLSTNALDVDGNLTIQAGTLDVSASNLAVTVGGNWSNSGTFTAQSGTVTLGGATTSATLNPGASAFNNLTLNKTAATGADDNIILQTNNLTVSGTFTITDGEFIQGSTNVTAGTISIASTGAWTNNSSGDITIGAGDLSNAGTITWNGHGGLEGDADAILLRSSSSPTQRTLSGSGTFTFTDIDIQDMAVGVTPGNINVTSGTNSGNNTGFTFLAGSSYKTWDGGGGADTNWDTGANWTGDTAPLTTEIVVFNTTSSNNVTVNVPVTVAGLYMTGYTGAVSQGSNAITVNGTFEQTSGTFTGGSADVDINGAFTLSGGTFNATSGATFVSGNFTVDGGTFGEGTGTVTLDGAASTINILGTETFNNLSFAPATVGSTKTVALNDSLTVTGTLTLTEGNIDQTTIPAAGTIAVQGGITHAATFDGGTGHLQITGSGTRTINLTGGGRLPVVTLNAPNVTLNGPSSGTVTVDGAFTLQSGTFTGGSGSVTFTGAFAQTGGTFTWGDGTLTTSAAFTQSGGTFNGGTGTVDLNSDFTLSGGTFVSTTGNLQVGRVFTHTAGGTFNHNNGTVVYDGGSRTMNVSTVEMFNNFTVTATTATTFTIAAGDTIVVWGTLTLTDGLVATGTLEARGNVVVNAGFDGGTALLNFAGTANQTYAGGGDELDGDVTINKPAGTVTLTANATLSAGTQDLFITSGTLDLAGFNINVGLTLWVQANGTLRLQGSETITTSGVVPSSGGTIRYYGSNPAYTLKNYAYTNLIIDGGSSTVFSFPASITTIETLTLNNSVTALAGFDLTAATLVNNATLRLQGNEAVSITTMDTDSGAVEYVGRNVSETLVLNDFGGTDYFNLTLNDTNVNKATFSSNAAKSVAGAFNVSSGTYDANGNTTAVTGLTTASGGTYLASTSTQTFNGGLTVSGTGVYIGSSGEADVNGVLTLSGGTLTAPTTNLRVSGNFSHSGGVFAHNGGTVVLDGAGQSVSGSNTFNNLTKTTAGATTLTFDNTATQTILGTLTLQGVSGNLLSLRSDVPGSQWDIDPQGTRTIGFLDVQDSRNVNAAVINAYGLNVTDSGNNLNWAFSPPASAAAALQSPPHTTQTMNTFFSSVFVPLGNGAALAMPLPLAAPIAAAPPAAPASPVTAAAFQGVAAFTVLPPMDLGVSVPPSTVPFEGVTVSVILPEPAPFQQVAEPAGRIGPFAPFESVQGESVLPPSPTFVEWSLSWQASTGIDRDAGFAPSLPLSDRPDTSWAQVGTEVLWTTPQPATLSLPDTAWSDIPAFEAPRVQGTGLVGLIGLTDPYEAGVDPWGTLRPATLSLPDTAWSDIQAFEVRVQRTDLVGLTGLADLQQVAGMGGRSVRTVVPAPSLGQTVKPVTSQALSPVKEQAARFEEIRGEVRMPLMFPGGRNISPSYDMGVPLGSEGPLSESTIRSPGKRDED